ADGIVVGAQLDKDSRGVRFSGRACYVGADVIVLHHIGVGGEGACDAVGGIVLGDAHAGAARLAGDHVAAARDGQTDRGIVGAVEEDYAVDPVGQRISGGIQADPVAGDDVLLRPWQAGARGADPDALVCVAGDKVAHGRRGAANRVATGAVVNGNPGVPIGDSERAADVRANEVAGDQVVIAVVQVDAVAGR